MFLSDGAQVSVYGDNLADRVPLLSDATYYSQIGMHLSGTYAAYAEIYKRQLWAYAIPTKIGRAVARLPFPVYKNNGTDRQRVTPLESAYADLLARPNPTLDPFRLWLWTATTFEVYGEAIWVKLRDDRGRVRELHPIHPTNLLLRRQPDGTIVYLYTAGTRNTALLPAIPEADVIHFRGYSPDSLMRGLSPMEPLNQTLLAEDAARRASAAMWANGARPSVALSHPNRLSDDAHRRLEASWNAKHTGVDNWAKTAILEEGMQPHVMQLSAEEMQYTASRHLNREECCAAWDIPPPAVHILDRATFSNITEQFRSVYRDTMPPRLGLYESTLQHQLAPDFFKLDGPVYGEFLLDEVLRGDFEQRAAATAQAIGTGQMTPAEARKLDNRPFIEGSDQLLVNAALIPLKTITSVSRGTGTDVEEVPQKVKSLTASGLRRVLRRLDAAETVADVDEHAFTAGLAPEAATDVLGLLRAAQARDTDMQTLRSWLTAGATSDLELEESTV